MLSDNQIHEIEVVFLMLDSGQLNDELVFNIINKYYHYNYHMFIYLQWLLTRWRILRNDVNDLPKKSCKKCERCLHFAVFNYCGNCGKKRSYSVKI